MTVSTLPLTELSTLKHVVVHAFILLAEFAVPTDKAIICQYLKKISQKRHKVYRDVFDSGIAAQEGFVTLLTHLSGDKLEDMSILADHWQGAAYISSVYSFLVINTLMLTAASFMLQFMEKNVSRVDERVVTGA